MEKNYARTKRTRASIGKWWIRPQLQQLRGVRLDITEQTVLLSAIAPEADLNFRLETRAKAVHFRSVCMLRFLDLDPRM